MSCRVLLSGPGCLSGLGLPFFPLHTFLASVPRTCSSMYDGYVVVCIVCGSAHSCGCVVNGSFARAAF